MNPFSGLLRSRKFWLLMLDTVISLILYFAGRYAPAGVFEDANRDKGLAPDPHPAAYVPAMDLDQVKVDQRQDAHRETGDGQQGAHHPMTTELGWVSQDRAIPGRQPCCT